MNEELFRGLWSQVSGSGWPAGDGMIEFRLRGYGMAQFRSSARLRGGLTPSFEADPIRWMNMHPYDRQRHAPAVIRHRAEDADRLQELINNSLTGIVLMVDTGTREVFLGEWIIYEAGLIP